MDAAIILELGRLVFIASLAALAIHDVVTFRIPNWANAALAVAFLPFAAAAGLAGAEVWWLGHLAACVIVFVVGFGMFQMRALGGGDVKLLAAAALWIGWGGLLPFVVWVGISGGGLVLLLLALRKNLPMLIAWASPTIPQSWPRVLTSGEKVPYGVAIAIGGILAMLGGQAELFTGRF
jgi:prepilin peptidase CpaA